MQRTKLRVSSHTCELELHIVMLPVNVNVETAKTSNVAKIQPSKCLLIRSNLLSQYTNYFYNLEKSTSNDLKLCSLDMNLLHDKQTSTLKAGVCKYRKSLAHNCS